MRKRVLQVLSGRPFSVDAVVLDDNAEAQDVFVAKVKQNSLLLYFCILLLLLLLLLCACVRACVRACMCVYGGVFLWSFFFISF